MKNIIYIGNHLKSTNPTTLNLLTELLAVSGYHIEIYSNKQSKIFRLLHMCWGVLKNTKANCILIDTYSTTNFYYAFIISQLARLFSIAYIPILHGGNLPNRLKNNPKLCKLIFEKSFVNVAPSNYLKEQFQKHNFKTKFIPNAITLEQYSFKARRTIKPNLLWVRAFDEIYNPKMAIDVLEIVKKSYPEATLCMVGADKDGSFEKVKELVMKKGLLESVEFAGYLSKKDWIEKSSSYDIFINTTTIDNTPVSVIEAMALGLAVVSTDVGGITYLVENGVTASLVASNNPNQMAEKIIGLIKNPNKAFEMTKSARKSIESFDCKFVQQQWNELLK